LILAALALRTSLPFRSVPARPSPSRGSPSGALVLLSSSPRRQQAVETSLHRQLKERYGRAADGRVEVALEGFRIDAIDADGALVEVQSGPLGPLQPKLRRLLPAHRVRVIKPVILRRRLIRRERRGGADRSARLSPRRGALIDVFDDLVGLARLLPHPNLDVDVLAVDIDEIRLPRRRWPGYRVLDRRLSAIVETIPLRQGQDLWTLLPDPPPCPFTTRDLAARLERPLDFAQRVAYCLHYAGAVTVVGKQGNSWIYARHHHPMIHFTDEPVSSCLSPHCGLA
jgi:hypothetical protein